MTRTRQIIAGVSIAALGVSSVAVDATTDVFVDKGDYLETPLVFDSKEQKVKIDKMHPKIEVEIEGGAPLVFSLDGEFEENKKKPLSSIRVWKSKDQSIEAIVQTVGITNDLVVERVERGTLLGADSTANGVEFDVVLNKKPAFENDEEMYFTTYTVENAEQYQFWYQPPMTDEEIADGYSRPDDIVGSYAVYKKDDAFNETGKVMHIYRPRIEDANGDWVYGNLRYEDGMLEVATPIEFLEKAKYPVRIDPTLGYTTVGATTYNNWNFWCEVGVMTEHGVLASSSAYIGSSAIVERQFGIYDAAVAETGFPNRAGEHLYHTVNDLIATSATGNVIGGLGWESEDYTANLEAENEYWTCIQDNPTALNAYYDASPDSKGRTAWDYDYTPLGTWPDDHSFDTYFSNPFTMYSTYNAVATATSTEASAWSSDSVTMDAVLNMNGDSEVDVSFKYGTSSNLYAYPASLTTTTAQNETTNGTVTDSFTPSETPELYYYTAVSSSTHGTFEERDGTFVVAADVGGMYDWDDAWDEGTFSTTSTTTYGMGVQLDREFISGTFAYVGGTTYAQAGNGSAADITLPAGAGVGDLVLVAGGSDIASSRDMSVNTSGYTTITSSGAGDPDMLLSFKYLTTAETVVNVTPTDFTNRDTVWVVQVWEDCALDRYESDSGSTDDPNSPSIAVDATYDNLVFSVGFLDDDDVVGSPTISGYSNVIAVDTQYGLAGISVMMASKEVAAGSGTEDPPVWSTTGNDAWRAVSLQCTEGSNLYQTGHWISKPVDVGSITDVDDSKIVWDVTTPEDSSVDVYVGTSTSSTTDPTVWTETTTSGSSITGINAGDDLTGEWLYVKVVLNGDTSGYETPELNNLWWGINTSDGGADRRIITIM